MARKLNRRGFLAAVAAVFGAAFAPARPGPESVWIRWAVLRVEDWPWTKILDVIPMRGRELYRAQDGRKIFTVYDSYGNITSDLAIGLVRTGERMPARAPAWRWSGGNRFEKISPVA